MKQREGAVEYLVPSTLGIGLVEGYNAIGFDKSLSKPHLRRLVSDESSPYDARAALIIRRIGQTETRMTQVCDGIKSKQEVIDETLDEYREMFLKTKAEFQTFVDVRVFSLAPSSSLTGSTIAVRGPLHRGRRSRLRLGQRWRWERRRRRRRSTERRTRRSSRRSGAGRSARCREGRSERCNKGCSKGRSSAKRTWSDSTRSRWSRQRRAEAASERGG